MAGAVFTLVDGLPLAAAANRRAQATKPKIDAAERRERRRAAAKPRPG